MRQRIAQWRAAQAGGSAMKMLTCCILVVMLSGCIPIGIQANTRAISPIDRSATPGSASASSPALY
jgi:hypothetical protein